MPIPWAAVDNNFPTLGENEPQREQIVKLVNYMAILTEQLKYTLNNLDSDNWNDAAYDSNNKNMEELRKQLKELTPTDITAELEFSEDYPKESAGTRFIRQADIVWFRYVSTETEHAAGSENWLFRIPPEHRPDRSATFYGRGGDMNIVRAGSAYMERLDEENAGSIIVCGWWTTRK